jgi:hypothetical protein
MVQVIHNRLDDLESFYHVLLWVSLQHARHRLRPEDLYNVLTRLFDDVVFVDDQAYADIGKELHMQSTGILDKIRFQNPPLKRLLHHISITFAPLYNPPPERDILPTEEEKEYYQSQLQRYEAKKAFLHSEEHSKWMEVAFQKTL